MGIPRAAVSPCSVLQSIDWEGEQGHLELTLVDARTVFGRHRTRGPEGRERWLILQGEVVSYPERCAEHGDPRSASASASSVSAFFSAFFPLVRGRALHRPRPPLYWNMGISDSAMSLMLTE